MKTLLYYLSITFALICAVAMAESPTEIRLTVGKDRVLPPKLRENILTVAESNLNRSDEAFLALINEVKTPYPVEERPSTPEETSTKLDNIDIPVIYDDASKLEIVLANFSKQVRGTLAKGDVYYLQLKGGGLLQSGSSFPVEISQIGNQSFTVTIAEVNLNGYTLKLNDVTREFRFGTSSGATKDSFK